MVAILRVLFFMQKSARLGAVRMAEDLGLGRVLEQHRQWFGNNSSDVIDEIFCNAVGQLMGVFRFFRWEWIVIIFFTGGAVHQRAWGSGNRQASLLN
mmetsp:Transcript_23919/g.32715  ORF Transcript_23919/g.32715 Transcript_23919/m.32715 type:complete len:97 (+) Transcript_23919:384-674(+)